MLPRYILKYIVVARQPRLKWCVSQIVGGAAIALNGIAPTLPRPVKRFNTHAPVKSFSAALFEQLLEEPRIDFSKNRLPTRQRAAQGTPDPTSAHQKVAEPLEQARGLILGCCLMVAS